MAATHARAMIGALADPQTLLVFGVIAARTSKLQIPASDRTRSIPYVTPYGLMRETSLSREVVEAATQRLERAGLLEVLRDDERDDNSWRISQTALAAASTGSDDALAPPRRGQRRRTTDQIPPPQRG